MTEPLLSPPSGRQDYNTNGALPTTSTRMAALLHRVYPGQDNRPTSKRELMAWYSYCFASEVYAVVSLSASLPGGLSVNSSDVYPCDVGTTRVRKGGPLL